MRIPPLCLPVLLCAAIPLHGQLAAQPGIQTYANPALGLRVNYSTTFDKEDVARLSTIPGALFASTATQPSSTPCAAHLLTLGSALGRADEITEKGKAPTFQPKGTLALTEINRTCYDTKILDDAILSEAISGTAKLEGMRPLTRVSNDYILGSTVWFTAVAGFNKDPKGKRTAAAGTTILGTAGAVVNGHLLVWTITANDPELFNRLLGISVCFDSGCDKGIAKLTNFRLNTPAPSEIATR